jgi:hypothetical protein
MEFVPGTISLDNVVGGTLLAGVVPLSRFRRGEDYQVNIDSKTVGVGGTTLITCAVGGCKVGDRVIAVARMVMTKGATAGLTDTWIEASAGGGAVCEWGGGLPAATTTYQPAAAIMSQTVVGLGRIITADGNFTFTLRAASAGSNGTVPIGGAAINVFVMRDSA